MSETANSQVRSKVWLRPDQVDNLRTACYQTGAEYLYQRNEAIIALLYDTGLRVGELAALDIDYLRDNTTKLYLPSHIQKDYPNENPPAEDARPRERYHYDCSDRISRTAGRTAPRSSPRDRPTESRPKAFATWFTRSSKQPRFVRSRSTGAVAMPPT